MLRSSTQLVKSHGDDLGLEYLWNKDEYSSFENSFKTPNMEDNSEILALVHVTERPITVHYEDSDKGTVSRGGGTHDIFGRGCATIKSLYRPFLEFLTKKLDPFRNFCA